MRISDWSSDVCSSDLPQPTNQALVKIDNRSAGKRTVQALRLPAYIVEHSQIAEVLHRLLQRCGTRAFQIAKFFFEQAGIATDVAADLASQRGFERDRWKRAAINKTGRTERKSDVEGTGVSEGVVISGHDSKKKK